MKGKSFLAPVIPSYRHNGIVDRTTIEDAAFLFVFQLFSDFLIILATQLPLSMCSEAGNLVMTTERCAFFRTGYAMPNPPLHEEEGRIQMDEHLRQLCEKASKEQDRDKLLKLVQEIITYPTKKFKVKENPRL